jgi:ech hydrogenase subunit D
MQNIETVKLENLIGTIQAKKSKNARLIAISASSKENTEISYSFDFDGEQEIVRIIINDGEVPSITKIYPYAFLYENEIKELFGVKINGISVDFNGNLYKVAKPAAFKSEEVKNG